MATRKQQGNPATKKQTTTIKDHKAREELSTLIQGLTQLFLAVEREIYEGKFRNGITAEEQKDIHAACEACLDALTTVTLLPPPPEVGERLLQRFLALTTADEVVL